MSKIARNGAAMGTGRSSPDFGKVNVVCENVTRTLSMFERKSTSRTRAALASLLRVLP